LCCRSGDALARDAGGPNSWSWSRNGRAGHRCAARRARSVTALPSSLLLAASFGTAALFLVEDIEGGYFDKLRAAPIPRTAIVFGRLIAEAGTSG
jgi:hypothetical protein